MDNKKIISIAIVAVLIVGSFVFVLKQNKNNISLPTDNDLGNNIVDTTKQNDGLDQELVQTSKIEEEISNVSDSTEVEDIERDLEVPNLEGDLGGLDDLDLKLDI